MLKVSDGSNMIHSVDRNYSAVVEMQPSAQFQ
jgi:hypothetical protein